MVVVVLRMERPRRPPPTQPIAPAAPYVEPPIPPEEPWGPLTQPNADLPAAVDDVLAKKCRRCHGSPARHSAPFPLYTWDDTRVMHNGQPIYERVGLAVKTGFMPNLIPANPPVEKLTEEEKKVVLDWVAAGAPRASDPAPGASSRTAPRPSAAAKARGR